MITCNRKTRRDRGRPLKRPFPIGPVFSNVENVSNELSVDQGLVKLDRAEVVLANYDLILSDFPNSFGAKFKSRYLDSFCSKCLISGTTCPNAIDKWLLKNAAYISKSQAEVNSINSEVHGVLVDTASYRPPRYGRAMVVEVRQGNDDLIEGLLDIKGCGVRNSSVPQFEANRNGLEYLGDALADYFYGWLIDKIFDMVGLSYQSVPIYAVIDTGFDIVDGWRGTAAAGLHIRRAHQRRKGGGELPIAGTDEEKIMIQMEAVLRNFGITSSTHQTTYKFVKAGSPLNTKLFYGGKQLELSSTKSKEKAFDLANNLRSGFLEMTNYQLANDFSWDRTQAQFVDLGHFHVRRDFYYPFTNGVKDTIFQVGRVFKPSDIDFPKRYSEVAIDAELFGRQNVTGQCFFLAQAFRKGTANRRLISMTLNKAIKKAFKGNIHA